MDRNEILERERRYATPVAVITIFAVALFAVQLVLLAKSYGGNGNAELLRKIDKDPSTIILAYVIRGIGSALLAVPFVYLFRAAQARSDAVRGQLIGLVIAGPIFLACFAVVTGIVLHNAGPDFVSVMKARHALGTGDHANAVAQDVIGKQSLSGLTVGFGIAGTLGFAVAMAYTCYHAMKVGLLTRFWGAVGVGLGVASILVLQYTLLWVAYLGLLIGGRTPKGRPPAWQAGEAVPWPTPGEKAAQSLGPGNEPGAAGEGNGADAAGNPPRERGERRKRKRRQQ